MPRISAARPGLCAACGARVERGEVVEYQLAVGVRHLACVDRPAALRRNLYRTACQYCGVELRPGAGLLEVSEAAAGPRWLRTWRAACEDVHACNARLRGSQGP